VCVCVLLAKREDRALCVQTCRGKSASSHPTDLRLQHHDGASPHAGTKLFHSRLQFTLASN
jgi:hypothetical protein